MTIQLSHKEFLQERINATKEYVSRIDTRVKIAFIYSNIFLYTLGVSLFLILKFIKALSIN